MPYDQRHAHASASSGRGPVLCAPPACALCCGPSLRRCSRDKHTAQVLEPIVARDGAVDRARTALDRDKVRSPSFLWAFSVHAPLTSTRDRRSPWRSTKPLLTRPIGRWHRFFARQRSQRRSTGPLAYGPCARRTTPACGSGGRSSAAEFGISATAPERAPRGPLMETDGLPTKSPGTRHRMRAFTKSQFAASQSGLAGAALDSNKAMGFRQAPSSVQPHPHAKRIRGAAATANATDIVAPPERGTAP